MGVRLKTIARLCVDRRAGSGVLFALIAPVMIGAAAISIDASMFYVKKRKLQSAVDMAALASVQNPSLGDTAARQSLTDNDIAFTSVAMAPGRYDATKASGARYTAGATPANAASVTASISTPMMFGRIFNVISRGTGNFSSQVTIGATGSAATVPTAAFGIGARLASINGGIANAVLSALLGANVSLSAVDYDALANASIDFDSYLQRIALTTGATSGNKVDVLGTSIPLSTAVSALAATGVDTRTAAALQDLLSALSGTSGRVTLGSLIDLGPNASLPISTPLPVKVSMNAYDIVSGLIGLAANGRPVTINLGAAVAGLASADLTLSIGTEGPANVVAPFATTTTASTRQIHLTLVTGVGVPGLGTVRLPIALDVASAKATTPGPVCTGSSASLGLSVTPSAVDLTIGTSSGTPAPIATILGLPIAGYAHAAVAATTPKAETFTTSDVAAKTIQTTSTTSVVASLVSTSLGQLQLSANGLPLPGILSNALVSTLTSSLLTLAGPTDVVLDSVMAALGLKIGQADTWVTDLRCGSPMLIQ